MNDQRRIPDEDLHKIVRVPRWRRVVGWVRTKIMLGSQCRTSRPRPARGDWTCCIRRRWHWGRHRDYWGREWS